MTSPLAVVALVGRMVVLFSLLMLVPLAFGLTGHDAAEHAFLVSTGVTFLSGALMSLATRRFRRELQPRDGFVLVGLTWLVLPAFGALPLLLAIPGLSVTDAYFEAMSGFTATGATALSGLDALPLSVNVWRCFMMLIGGLGIIVLAVAILPLLGVGGAQLFKAETAGPLKDAKLTPRIAETARGLWTVYFVVSVLCFFSYRAAGMSWPDAFMHMCSTMGLGGFSSHDLSFGYWNSPAIEAVAVVFMMLSGVSFALYFVAWKQRSLSVLWNNVEVRAFYLVVIATVALISIYLTVHGVYPDFQESLRHTVFHVVSIATTTGYASYDYAKWPLFAPLLMILLGCFATCAGSTGGGIKMVRMLLLLKQSYRELVRIVHPNVVNPVVIGGAAVSPRVIQSVIAYMMVYGASLVALTMLLLFSGLDVVTAFTAVIACVNNIGPGLGDVGPSVNYGGLSDFQIWVCTFGMLLGRLELLAVLVLFTPQFWRG
ncbi:MAG TPA: potassium transporter TrkG [Piscinibacter sp.]|jgi:trk system potassium uptake protein TrkH|nr:TrkH family potassium uptake protein [Piscinibacter sp.]HOY35630.1 potassium transporter TrkG [Piscinibacter sp.]HPG78904.1 potassium transporter TrkG [Piscinibacter sp.]HPM66041.1 potassium transporter TrkG [Piscinibacter sp.]